MKIPIQDLQSGLQNSRSPSTLADFGARVVTLCDGHLGLRGGLQVDIREPSEAQLSTSDSEPVLDFIASSETLDRYEEIISANGWRLDNYQRNPVFQNAYQYGDIIFTLGKALLTEVRTI